MKKVLILIVLFTTILHSQNDSIQNEQLKEYFKERGYAVPEPNTNIPIPTSYNSSVPIVTAKEINAYPLKKDMNETEKNDKSNEITLSLYDKELLSKNVNKDILESLKDNRASTTEYVSKAELEATNKSISSSNQNNTKNIYSYLILGLLISFVIFIVFRIKNKP